jgi:hypothetical protein
VKVHPYLYPLPSRERREEEKARLILSARGKVRMEQT